MNGRSKLGSGVLALGLAGLWQDLPTGIPPGAPPVMPDGTPPRATPPPARTPPPTPPGEDLRARIERRLAAEAERPAGALSDEVASMRADLDAALAAVATLEAELAVQRAAHRAELRRLERRHEAELATLRDRIAFERGAGSIDDPWDEIEDLRIELARERDRRLERERDWLGWSRALGAIAPADVHVPRFDVQVPVVPTEAIGPTPPEPEARTDRDEAIARSLRTLLAVEEVEGLDLIDAGALEGGAVGPVLFRLVDARGRLSGSLFAERLRLEGSRSGRSLTIVLEDGYEAHRGVRVPFDLGPDEPVGLREQGGERRLTLPHVDPMPWVEALPELFGGAELGRGPDDGLWDTERVRRALNALLAEDAAFGYPRFRQIGGVRDGVLREVHVESLDVDGRVERRLFADRVTLKEAERGIEILCEDGVHVRGDKKAAFLDGRYRIFLPRADVERWRRERLPGLTPAARADFFAPEND